MDVDYSICWGCDHYWANNEDGLLKGCRAFPDGISSGTSPGSPSIGFEHSHDKPYKEDVIIHGQIAFECQKNDYVYVPAKKSVRSGGRKIEIYQKSNPYADENGIYKF